MNKQRTNSSTCNANWYGQHKQLLLALYQTTQNTRRLSRCQLAWMSKLQYKAVSHMTAIHCSGLHIQKCSVLCDLIHLQPIHMLHVFATTNVAIKCLFSTLTVRSHFFSVCEKNQKVLIHTEKYQ